MDTGQPSTPPTAASVMWQPSDGSLIAAAVDERVDPSLDEPRRDLLGVEAEEVAPLDIGDAPLRNEASHVSDAHTEMFGDLADVDESRQLNGARSRRSLRFTRVRAGHGRRRHSPVAYIPRDTGCAASGGLAFLARRARTSTVRPYPLKVDGTSKRATGPASLDRTATNVFPAREPGGATLRAGY